jgi:hypothetical protein
VRGLIGALTLTVFLIAACGGNGQGADSPAALPEKTVEVSGVTVAAKPE